MDDIHLVETLRRSVVKLFTVIKEPSHYQPWELGYQHNSGGSACIVAGNRILTNAHVVANQLFIQALKPDDSKKYTARVLHVDHDTELALLTVDDPRFFEGTLPIELGDLPPPNAKVAVLGFPVGGNELCITAGVVSRIEVRTYTHSQRTLLALQTDAAINPGNSGGPVFMNGKLVGIAFQSYRRRDLEKSGYVVPIPIIKHFFEDLEDGVVTGVPDLGVFWQKIENEGLHEFVGLTGEQTGVLVSRVAHGSSSHGVIREGDVVMAIDGTAIACDGSIALREHHRVHFTFLVSQHQVGDSLAVQVLRDGKPLDVSVTLAAFVAMVAPPRPERPPTYLIFAGLVFVPLTYDYMKTWEWEKVHFRYKYYYYDRLPSEGHREIVILSEVLVHAINIGYHQMFGTVVERINGIEIRHMQDVARAFTKPLGKFHVIEIENHGVRAESSDYHAAYGNRIVIEADAVAKATPEILEKHGVARARSRDLEGDGG
ncbi:MAG: trypsin-like peptidase domain-containing protein [Deltaproteobacteria bacterium]|nr:trypsin-like peptidase domain-containing protein [Deltaproteobacteria bacterium]